MIKPLTQSEFASIATNGIRINLYDGLVEDYIESLMKFIEEVTQDYYISDYDTEWLEISKKGAPAIKVVYDAGKIQFLLVEKVLKTKFEKANTGNAIKVVYMHSVAWDAINNDGVVRQSQDSIIDPWPI